MSPIRPLRDSEYLYGIHDPGGEHVMLDLGIEGWVLVTEAIGYDAADTRGRDYRYLSDRGLGVMVRLNAGYGGVGTIPYERDYDQFARRCANFVANSQGAHIWIIGNEMNHPIEWPGADWDWQTVQPKNPDSRGEVITPSRYAKCFTEVRNAIRSLEGHEQDQVCTGAVAPWNALTRYKGNALGDWVQYFREMLLHLGADGLDGITLHTYSHGAETWKIDSSEKMAAPFQDYHYHFRAYMDFMQAIPFNMHHLPVYITETDQDDAWRNENNSWVQRAYGEIAYWNENHPDQQIRALVLYRWPKLDKWYIEGKQGVIDDFRQAMRWRYRWHPHQAVPGKPFYRAAISIIGDFKELPPGTELDVTVYVRNLGSLEWPVIGRNPVKLGYRWLDADGKPIRKGFELLPLPQELRSGQEIKLPIKVQLPPRAGQYTLVIDLIHEGVTWFREKGSKTCQQTVTIAPEEDDMEEFYEETGYWVRGPFLTFLRKIGTELLGMPVSDVISQDGVAFQLFQCAVMEEYTPGQVRLRPTEPEGYITRQRAAALQRAVGRLRQEPALRSFMEPVIADLSAILPRAGSDFISRELEDIQHIVISHTGLDPSVSFQAFITSPQMEWPALLSQFYIEPDGSIYQTNALDATVDDVRDWIKHGINISVAGNFTSDCPTTAQIRALAELCSWIMTEYGLTRDAVKDAGELDGTPSAGEQWLDGQRWKELLLEAIAQHLGSEHEPAEIPKKGRDESAGLKIATSEMAESLVTDQQQLCALEERLEALASTAGSMPFMPVVPQPEIKDVTDHLPRQADRMFARSADEIQYIVINHTAVPPNVPIEKIVRTHLTRWPAFVSQFYVQGDGQILRTNPLLEVVDDKQGWIRHGINIHVAGNFMDDIPNDSQMEALSSLVTWLMHVYHLGEEAVRGVQEFIVTPSPGKQWLHGKAWKELLLANIHQIATPLSAEDNGLQDQLNALVAEQLLLAQEAHDLFDRVQSLVEPEPAESQDQEDLVTQVDLLRQESARLKQRVDELDNQLGQLEDTWPLQVEGRPEPYPVVESETPTTAEPTSVAIAESSPLEEGLDMPPVLVAEEHPQPGNDEERAAVAVAESAVLAARLREDQDQGEIDGEENDLRAVKQRQPESESDPTSENGHSAESTEQLSSLHTAASVENVTVGSLDRPQIVAIVGELPSHASNHYDRRELEEITHIAIHHSAVPANISPERIATYHVSSPKHQWPGMGYHFYIGPDGTIWQTQDLDMASYHVYDYNHCAVGVCVAGNFDVVVPTPAQIEATARLIEWLQQEFDIPLENVMGHQEFAGNATTCPGKQWVEGRRWKDILFDALGVMELA